jgi:hypothetical protein
MRREENRGLEVFAQVGLETAWEHVAAPQDPHPFFFFLYPNFRKFRFFFGNLNPKLLEKEICFVRSI